MITSHAVAEQWQTRDDRNGRSLDSSTPMSALIELARAGHGRAREILTDRFLKILRRWAHSSITAEIRGLMDTDDLAQVTLCRVIRQLDSVEFRGEVPMLGYLRQALRNQVRDELRRAARRPKHVELDQGLRSEEPTPLERLIDAETMERYERALSTLTPSQRQVVILRLELGMNYREIAARLEVRSPNAVRTMVARALVRLARCMR